MELTANRILEVWEQANAAPRESRAQCLLSLAYSNSNLSSDELEKISIGERNSHLMVLRKALFGSSLEAYIECPQCSEALDLDVSVEQLGLDPGLDVPALNVVGDDSLGATVRLPNGRDLLALTNVNTAAEGRALLFERCISNVSKNGKATALSELKNEDLVKLETWVAELDPRSELLFDLSCPACAHEWQAPLDIATFLWSEFDVRAQTLLEDIHLLARNYGWAEHDILMMSESRRQHYVERLL